jgi:hypothetical protein
MVPFLQLSALLKARHCYPCNRSPCGGGLEYLHRIPASRKRRQKGTQCPGYNWATLFLEDINMGTLPSRLRESQMRQ